MKKNNFDKRKTIRKFIDILNTNNIRTFIFFVLLAVIIVTQCVKGSFDFETLFKLDVLVSVVLLVVCDWLARLIGTVFGKKSEDMLKLGVDYEKLVKSYFLDRNKMVKVIVDNQEEYIPVLELKVAAKHQYLKININYENANKEYQLPKEMEKYVPELMKAHKNSTIYNSRMIRVESAIISEEKDFIEIKYSLTTYFNSLITNRAIDYELSNKSTIRELYEPGPFISSLEQSKLSNHLGFNGFIELSDGYFVFVKRKDNLSIGKKTLSCSVAASMKLKYCLNKNRQLDVEHIGNAIREEIDSELKINLPIQKNIDLGNSSIFAYYRDLVEGGKPQFLFYYKVEGFNKNSFFENFKTRYKDDNKKDVSVDGTDFLFFTLDELKKAIITSDKLIIGDKKYKVMPSVSACVVMVLKWLDKNEKY